MFGHVKSKLKDFEFPLKTKKKPEKLAFEVQKAMFQIKKYTFEGFFKKTLNNMLQFWFTLKREKLLRKI